MTYEDRTRCKFERDKGYSQDRKEWEHYAFAKRMCEEQGVKSGKVFDYVKSVRLGLRHSYKAMADDWTEVFAHDDGAILTKCRFDHNVSEEEFQLIQNAIWLDCRYAHDCSGDRFTSWVELYNLKDGTAWIYHKTNLDV